jgi:hypothetical protein
MRAVERTDGRTDGRTDITKLIVAFRNFANVPKNGRASCHSSVVFRGYVPRLCHLVINSFQSQPSHCSVRGHISHVIKATMWVALTKYVDAQLKPRRITKTYYEGKYYDTRSERVRLHSDLHTSLFGTALDAWNNFFKRALKINRRRLLAPAPFPDLNTRIFFCISIFCK